MRPKRKSRRMIVLDRSRQEMVHIRVSCTRTVRYMRAGQMAVGYSQRKSALYSLNLVIRHFVGTLNYEYFDSGECSAFEECGTCCVVVNRRC